MPHNAAIRIGDILRRLEPDDSIVTISRGKNRRRRGRGDAGMCVEHIRGAGRARAAGPAAIPDLEYAGRGSVLRL